MRTAGRAVSDLLGQAQTTGALTILSRILSYGKKIFDLPGLVAKIGDRRLKPRIPTTVVTRCILAMFLTRMGSLNALEQTALSPFWRRWLQAPLPSADSIGRIAAVIEPDPVRQALQHVYSRLKHNKALPPAAGGLMALLLDGHESHATYRRCCDGCLKRTVGKRKKRTQYYHKHVTAMLLGGAYPLLLDAEPLRRGEDELAAARRLLERAFDAYPRAFDVVVGDAFYADSGFYNFVLDHGKDMLTVLKANRQDLLTDANALFAEMEGVEVEGIAYACQAWDLDGFTTWPQVKKPIRVVRSCETSRVRRQLDREYEEPCSTWMWVTTLTPHRASTATVIKLGHARWCIENEGFNETVNRWSADHVYKHDANAMLVFWLLTMLAFNLFHAFYFRNLSPAIRKKNSCLHFACCMASQIYHDLPLSSARPP